MDNVERLKAALYALQKAEADYRHAHDTHGDGTPQSGYAWDQMRRAGNRARTLLQELTKDAPTG